MNIYFRVVFNLLFLFLVASCNKEDVVTYDFMYKENMHRLKGGIQHEILGDTLHLFNIDRSGNDGIEILLDDSKGFDIKWHNINDFTKTTIQDEASIFITYKGRVNDVSDQIIASMEIRKVGDQLKLSADSYCNSSHDPSNLHLCCGHGVDDQAFTPHLDSIMVATIINSDKFNNRSKFTLLSSSNELKLFWDNPINYTIPGHVVGVNTNYLSYKPTMPPVSDIVTSVTLTVEGISDIYITDESL